ncbi:MAG: RsmE family RNA methyltransferase [Planctomycetaceae bacterium]
MRRFFAGQPLETAQPGQPLTLPQVEAEHLRKVLRLTAGDGIELFDGQGRAVNAVVTSVDRRQVVVRIDSSPGLSIPPRPRLTIAVAPPKGERFRWLVEKCVELAVDRIVPVIAHRSVVEPGDGKLKKLTDVVIAACKQSGRNDLLVIEPSIDWQAFLAQWTAGARLQPGGCLLLADPHGRPLAEQLARLPSEATTEVTVLIGPEGGLTPEETERATAAAALPVSLGVYIQRVETAAVAMAASLRTWTATRQV